MGARIRVGPVGLVGLVRVQLLLIRRGGGADGRSGRERWEWRGRGHGVVGSWIVGVVCAAGLVYRGDDSETRCGVCAADRMRCDYVVSAWRALAGSRGRQ